MVIVIEDVRREVMILKSLFGYDNFFYLYDIYEDYDDVYRNDY